MNRRRFLSYALSATAGVVAVGMWQWVDDGGSRRDGVAPDDDRAFERRVERLETIVGHDDRALILALVPDLESAISIGRHALPVDASYQHEGVVLDRLRSTLLVPWRRTAGGLGTFVDAYRASVARDHRDGRVVVLDGWVLSATRVDVCALASLVHERVGARLVES